MRSVSTPGVVRLRVATGLAALTLTALVAFAVDLGRPALWDPGEGRYAQTVREMLTHGSWLAPTLNLAPYYDKPPGYYWLLAGSFRAFGFTEWAARLPSALPALLTIALTVGFAWRRMGPIPALGAGLILATTTQFVALGRSVRMDMLLTCLVSATLFRAYALWQDDGAAPGRARPPRTWPIYVLPAIGLLVKGPVAALLPAMVLGTMTVLTGERRRLARLRPGPGLLVALAIAATWYVGAAVYAPAYLVTFLWDQNVGRFLDAATGHPEPFWYFLWMLPVTFLPWTLFLPGALHRAARRARRWHDLDLFLLAWIGLTVLFFSVSSAKLATYVLPTFPPLALLVARYLAAVARARAATQRRALLAPGVLWTAVLAAIAVATPVVVGVRFRASPTLAAWSLLLLPFAAYGAWAARRARWGRVPALVMLSTLVIHALFYRVGAPVVDEFVSLRGAAEAARDLPARTAMYAYKTRGHSFAFYDGRVVTRLRSPAAAAAVLAGPEPSALLTKEKHLDAIRAHLPEPVCVWWESASARVLVTNLPPLLADGGRLLAPGAATGAAPRSCRTLVGGGSGEADSATARARDPRARRRRRTAAGRPRHR